MRHGDELSVTDWREIHKLYLGTFAERGNHPALTLGFFRHLGAALRRQVLAVLCRRGADIIAMAFLLRSATTLYGRYWGCHENVPGLHFEACYYQGIEYCLQHGLTVFEPGAQGEHKLARGFLPTRTQSFHYLADARFRAAVREALAREAVALEEYRCELLTHSPSCASLTPPTQNLDCVGAGIVVTDSGRGKRNRSHDVDDSGRASCQIAALVYDVGR